jgi:hypothetical protein
VIEKYGDLVARAVGALTLTEWYFDNRENPDQSHTVSDDGLRAAGVASLDNARRLAILTDWDGLQPQIDRLELRLTFMDFPPPGISREFRALNDRIRDDLKVEHFFHLAPADVPLYLGAEPFGSAVGRAFPKTSEDIAEAAKCLALQRPTACVFHLMRVMEEALRTLAKKLNVKTINPNIESWNKITDHVNKVINALPAGTDKEKTRKVKWGSALAHLNSVRIAWRNEVMHPKQSYTREEGHTIFNAVRAFMIDLAALK